MEAFITELFLKTTYSLPYTCDRKSSSHEAGGQVLVTQALEHIDRHVTDASDDELDYAVMFLVANLDIHPWNTSELTNKAHQIYRHLMTGRYEESEHFLINRPQLCKKVNTLISRTLKRDVWQSHAAACALYKWYCSSLRFPMVSEHLEVLLPPSLLLVDSYDDELKVSGVECLRHIICQSGKTELRWHGRAQVIYDALFKLSYTHCPSLVSVLHPTLIKILEVVEDGEPACERKVDSVYQRLLSDMYLEDKLVLRRTYALSAKLYIAYLDTDVIKHLKKTMKVVLNYLEDSCGSTEETRLITLETVELLIKQGTPRIQRYYADITKALLRVIVDTAMLPIDTDAREDITSRVTGIFLEMIKEDDSSFICESLNMIVSDLPVRTDKQGRLIVGCVQRMLAILEG